MSAYSRWNDWKNEFKTKVAEKRAVLKKMQAELELDIYKNQTAILAIRAMRECVPHLSLEGLDTAVLAWRNGNKYQALAASEKDAASLDTFIRGALSARKVTAALVAHPVIVRTPDAEDQPGMALVYVGPDESTLTVCVIREDEEGAISVGDMGVRLTGIDVGGDVADALRLAVG